MTSTQKATLEAIAATKELIHPLAIPTKRVADLEGWKKDKKARKAGRKSRKKNRR